MGICFPRNDGQWVGRFLLNCRTPLRPRPLGGPRSSQWDAPSHCGAAVVFVLRFSLFVFRLVKRRPSLMLDGCHVTQSS